MNVAKCLSSLLFLSVLCVSVVFAQATGDYRTAQSGNWNDVSTWQVFDGSAWGATTAAPDSNSIGAITILPGHTVTVTASTTADSLYVNDTGKLIVASGSTLIIGVNNNKPGLVLQGLNALEVSGTLENRGNIIGAQANRNVDFDPAVDTALFKAGGVYNHARNGGTPIAAKWDSGSTYLMTGITANYPNRVSQNFYNFVWNCPNQTRGDGQVNFYRTRVRGNITILSNGTTWGHDRDVRMCDNFPARATIYEDTVWVDGNIEVRKAPAGQFSRLAISGGGYTNVISVLIVKGNIIVEDSCVFGRTNSNTQNRVELYGDLTVSGGGMIYTGAANIVKMKKFVFKKQGTQKLTIADGTGAFNRGATVVGQMGWQVSSGTTLDIGTSKIDTLDSGFFVIDNGGAVKISYGANSGKIACKGEQGIVDTGHTTIGTTTTPHGNALAVAKNVVGTGTITYAASVPQNLSNPSKAIPRAWTITPSGTIKSGDLVLAYSPFDIPTGAAEKVFVGMKYASGTDWVNRIAAVKVRIDTTWDVDDQGKPIIFSIDTVITGRGATLTGVTDLAGVWSVGEASLTRKAVTAATDTVFWPLRVRVNGVNVDSGYVSRNAGNVKGDSVRFAKIGSLYGEIPGSFLYYNGSMTSSFLEDPDSAKVAYPRIDIQNILPGQTAAGYPPNTIDSLQNVWVQYRVSPNPGYVFKVNNISFDIIGSGSGSMRARAFISTDPNFSSKTEIYNTGASLPTAGFARVTVPVFDVALGSGNSLFLRVYTWIHNQSGYVTGKRVVLRNVEVTGTTEPSTSVALAGIGVPAKFSVEQNFPNPFNPTTNIRFEIPKASNVTVKVFNLLGQEVALVFSGQKEAGSYTLPFQAGHLSSGAYIYKVEAGDFVGIKRMILLK